MIDRKGAFRGETFHRMLKLHGCIMGMACLKFRVNNFVDG